MDSHHHLLRPRWNDFDWRSAAGAAKLIAVLIGIGVTLFGFAYGLWPAIEIKPVKDDVSARPLEARFQFKNSGKLDLPNEVTITCIVRWGAGRPLVMSGNLSGVAWDKRGTKLVGLPSFTLPVERSCGAKGLRFGQPPTHPSAILIEAKSEFLRFFTVKNHQYFISVQIGDGAYKMVPDADPFDIESLMKLAQPATR